MKSCCKNISFGDARVVYCTVCGKKHNKERKGRTILEYPDHVGSTAFKKYTRGSVYFKKIYRESNDIEHINYMEYVPVRYVVGNGNGATIHFKHRYISISKKVSYIGPDQPLGLGDIVFSQSFISPISNSSSIESANMTEEEIFDMGDVEYNKLVVGKIRPVWYEDITKKEFDEFENKVLIAAEKLSEICDYVVKEKI